MATIMEWVNGKIAEKKAKKTTTTGQNRHLQRVAVTRTAYVNKVGSDGWISVKIEKTGSIKSVCKFTKFTLLDVNDSYDRVTFKIEDGAFKGQTASMRIKGGIDTYLGDTAPTKSTAKVTVKYGTRDKKWYSKPRGEYLDQQLATLTADGVTVTVTLNSDWDPRAGRTPIPKGTYEILVPDYPHNQGMTAFYTHNDKPVANNSVWFPIHPKADERYIHIGHLSHGCVTIIGYDKYPAIHDYLIKHRAIGKNGQEIVGYLEVSK